MQFFKTVNLDYIKNRRYAYAFSSVLFLTIIISYIVRGGFNLGIDFKGGTSILIQFEQKITTQDIRDVLNTIGLGNSEIKSYGSKQNEYLIYIGQQKNLSASEMVQQVEKAIKASPAGSSYEILRTDTIGPKIGQELRKATMWAILLSLLIMLIYLGWRFEFVFAVGAVVALFHDVIIVVGAFVLLNYEISIKEVAAFLTIVGYSINDTIVIYDRIRENLKIYRNDNLETILNRSVNQCMGRTINTSLTVLLVVTSLYILGGEVIKGFAFAMLIGVFEGVYSTIFVASPIVYEWQVRHGGKEKLKMAKKKIR